MRLHRAVEELRRSRSPLFERVTTSVGAAVAHVPSMVAQPQDLVDAADQCLYRSKDNGRDCAFKREGFDGPIAEVEPVHLSPSLSKTE